MHADNILLLFQDGHREKRRLDRAILHVANADDYVYMVLAANRHPYVLKVNVANIVVLALLKIKE